MQIEPGTRLGPFEITSLLGAGGMGEVFRARDTRLGRDVAIKVLSQHLSAQPEVRARFEREARTVSGLNHPNICTLYDVGREGDIDYLVMELIEGETLADRLRRGPLPIADVLRFGTQVADALDRAHRAGVIHRDLKPGNVMITRAGAKLMDFGLARATGMVGSSGSSGSVALTQSPTMAHPLTAEGTIVGTFQYMSPEQLEGREADARSDIWAFGCVLYEMITGRRAFEGRSQAGLIAAILEREPSGILEPPSSSGMTPGGRPPGLDRLVRNCLAKDPEERIQTAHDIKLQLQGIAENVGLAATSVVSAPAPDLSHLHTRSGALRLAWGVALIALLVAVGSVGWLLPKTHQPAPPSFRFRSTAIPNTIENFWPRISPDGKYLLLQAVDSTGTDRAYVRQMNEIEAHPIPGTENLQRAYWSFDSREIAFVAGGKIQRVAIAGGSPFTVAAAPGGADLSWGAKGQILMDGQFTDSLRVVPAGGGDLKPASRIDRAAGEIGSAWPCFLPDGEHFLFIGNLASTPNGAGNIRLGRLGSLDSKLLGHSDGRVEYAPGGWVLFLRGGTLLAQKLDLGHDKLTGEPITLAENIRVGNANGHFSISQTGILAFSRKDNLNDAVLQVADRKGQITGPLLATGTLTNPRLSPDRHRLLYQLAGRSGVTGEIHVLDLDRATDTRLTFTGEQAITPEWSPDGRRFAYVIRGTYSDRLHIGAADGLGGQDSIQVPPRLGGISLFQWSTADSRLLFSSAPFKGFAVQSDGPNRTPEPLPDSTLLLAQQQISPDGKWLAYATGTSALNVNVYVQSLQGPPGRWQISNKPALRPRWTKGGREIIYEGVDQHLMAVDIETQNGFHAGTPHVLFAVPQASTDVAQASWCCDGDGELFYLVIPPKNHQAASVEIVTAFNELVSRK